MKYLPLLWYGLRRKPLRTTLIVLQVALALGLFAVLQGIEKGAAVLVAQFQADVLVVQSLRPGSLPVADVNAIRHIRGVRAVSYENYLFATYQRPTQHIMAVAVDVADAFKTIPVEKISPSVFRTLVATRDGAVATTVLANRFGWKPGQRIHLSTALPLKKGHDIGLKLVGTLIPAARNGNSDFLVIHNSYLDALRASGRGTVHQFDVRVVNPRDDNRVARMIDAHFRNSPYPTRTESARALEQTGIKRIDDMAFVVRAVTAAALFSLLISMGAILVASARERTLDMAVMKAMGFGNRCVAGLLVTESLVVCVTGASLGFAASTIVFAKAQVRFLGLSMPWIVLLEGLGLACAVACLTTVVPAWRALRLDVSSTLGAQ